MRFSFNNSAARTGSQTPDVERLGAFTNGEAAPGRSPRLQTPQLIDAKVRLHHKLIDELNLSHIEKMPRAELRLQVSGLITDYVHSERVPLNANELTEFIDEVLDELIGLGPIEPILKDPTVTDILINTHERVYVERHGQLEPVPVRFKDEAHVLRIVNKIVGAVGRRVDESSPMVDARLLDGSRINVAIKPIAVDGPLVSIRKFAKKTLDIERLVKNGTMSATMAKILGEAVRARLSILISGGTGSGKTTFLNALSSFVSNRERLITIEDAAELQLQQPHVGRLETRPPNLEGRGEIRQRELVKNALRMRPDRIIVGEVRGEEAFDMLQAMTTGHEGSMTTIHANTPRDAVSRLEQMVGMAGFPMSETSIRSHIASAIKIIVADATLSRWQAARHQHQRDRRVRWDGYSNAGAVPVCTSGAGLGRGVPGHGIAPFVRGSTGNERCRNPRECVSPRSAPMSGLFSTFGGLGVASLVVLILLFCGYFLALEAAFLSVAGQLAARHRLTKRLVVKDSPSAHPADLIKTRRGRGLSSSGDYTLPNVWLNRLVVQSGVSWDVRRFPILFVTIGVAFLAVVLAVTDDFPMALVTGLFAGPAVLVGMLAHLRAKRRRALEDQLPEAIDILVRSLKAGHPVSSAIGLVARELGDPIGTEFKILADELTYGLDLETAMNNMATRVGQEDLVLVVIATGIQAGTGGNLAEILGSLSKVVRERLKMRLKVKAMSAEGRFSAIILTVLPFALFGILWIVAPQYYGEIWHLPLVKASLLAAAFWLSIGNVVMYRMVNFKV